ncbi:MAG TPA: inositol monophosphatase [Candidatus Saccharimonadales bacterium]|nr:inositol monophosphatase [Candidatus Saccharimonadales bacterium]
MSKFRPILLEITAKAGQLIMNHRAMLQTAVEKEKNEIVTPADIAANDYIVSELKRAFPDIAIYTEEGSKDKSNSTTRWIVDPVDGTTPWVWGNSGFAISIALEQDAEVTVAGVYDPVMQEFFYAEKGKGATRNGLPIHPSAEIDNKSMLMVVDWGNKDEKRREGIAYFTKFILPEMFARRVVPQFAPALGLCRIAEGRIHALVCNDTWVEDHSAGALILRESGGYCSNFYETASFSHRQSGIIATNNKSTHDAILALLRG